MSKRLKLTYKGFLNLGTKLKEKNGIKYFSLSACPNNAGWTSIPKPAYNNEYKYDLFIINKYGIFNKE